MDNIYKNEMSKFAIKVLDDVNAKLPKESKLFNDNEVTPYGKYVLPLVVPQIAKFAIVKAFVPKATVDYNKRTGEITYDYNELLNTHLQSLDLPKAGSPQDEAMLVLQKMRKGIENIPSNSQDFITKSLLA